MALRRVLVACVVAALLLVAAAASEAQTGVCTTSPCAVQKAKAFHALADHDGIDTTGYRLYVNGAVEQTVPLSALVNGVVTFSVAAGLPVGTHVIYIEAFGEGGAEASTTLTLVVSPGKPKAPVNLRVLAP
jgi:hypothetical protein